jgi:hypothetical protein
MNQKGMEGLKKWLQENRTSRKKFAEVLSVSTDSVYRALRGQPISKEFAWKIHVLTGLRLLDLLFEDDDGLIEKSLYILKFKGNF